MTRAKNSENLHICLNLVMMNELQTNFLVVVQVRGSHGGVAVLADGQQVVRRRLSAVELGHDVSAVEGQLGNHRHAATKASGHSDVGSHVLLPHAAFHQMGNLFFFINGGQGRHDLVQQEGGYGGAERLVGKIFGVTTFSNFRENTLFQRLGEQVVEFVQVGGVGVVDHPDEGSVVFLEVLHVHVLGPCS